jgi:alpha-galactosidase
MPENVLFTYFCDSTWKLLGNPDCNSWKIPERIEIISYWNGRSRRQNRQTESNQTSVRSLWNRNALFVRFDCSFDSLNLRTDRDFGKPAMGLWEFDVVELFLRRPGSPGYFEFESSPSGHWLDARINQPRKDADFEWDSRMETATRLDRGSGIWISILRIPFASITPEQEAPEAGAAWRTNLFRVYGKHPHRHYLSWRPTFTENPDFHVPDAFGNLIFIAPKADHDQ